MNNILAIAVHPDDETLGCGGTLLRFKAEGASIHWLLITAIYAYDNGQYITWQGNKVKYTCENNKIEPINFPLQDVKRRANEIEQVKNNYSFDTLHELCFPAMCLDQLPLGLIISKISEVINSIKPDTIILPFKSDVHSDHRIAFESAFTCTKSFRYPFIKQVMMMETISETDFAPSTKEDMYIPNIFIDIKNYIEQKIEIMQLYKGEMDEHPFPRSKKI